MPCFLPSCRPSCLNAFYHPIPFLSSSPHVCIRGKVLQRRYGKKVISLPPHFI
jgi:hypothetical protein